MSEMEQDAKTDSLSKLKAQEITRPREHDSSVGRAPAATRCARTATTIGSYDDAERERGYAADNTRHILAL